VDHIFFIDYERWLSYEGTAVIGKIAFEFPLCKLDGLKGGTS
jgi:hypothetical protein